MGVTIKQVLVLTYIKIVVPVRLSHPTLRTFHDRFPLSKRILTTSHPSSCLTSRASRCASIGLPEQHWI